jgi:pre-mRNA-splicing factor ATP-dependent RNA helicase DHX15/PRP43
MSVAARVAQELDVELGNEVGYLIRFEDVTSDKTVLKYLTDGMLLRECASDPLMSKYSVIILDEAHERTLSTDILFGLLKDVLARRPELRLVVMSATLESKKFQEYWDDAPLLTVPGRMYPVETFFTLRPEKDYVQAAVEVCVLIHTQEGPGDILLFLTGEEEIETAAWEIESSTEDNSTLVLKLYSSLPMQQQRKVFPPAPEGVRKIIVATNIAETSLTIDGVVYVVDPGLVKQKLYNPRTHAESLLVSPISRAAAMQRAGRAGRTRPGKCFRLYTHDTFCGELPESQYPEIVRSNLCSVVIALKRLGADDIVNFDFMEPPSPEAMMRALEMLYFLGAIDEESDLTEVGKQMGDFPVDPHLSKCLISAAHRGCGEEMLRIIALLSVPPIFSRPRHALKAADRAHKQLASGLGDHLTLLATYSRYTSAPDRGTFCYEHFLQERSMKQAENICKQLRGIARKLKLISDNATPLKDGAGMLTAAVRKSLVDGFFMQSAVIDNGGKNYLTARDQQLVNIHPSSFLQHKPEWVVYHETIVTDRCYMRNVTAMPPEFLIEVAPKHFHPDLSKLGETATKSLLRALPRVKVV